MDSDGDTECPNRFQFQARRDNVDTVACGISAKPQSYDDCYCDCNDSGVCDTLDALPVADTRPEFYEGVCDTLDALPETARGTLDARPENYEGICDTRDDLPETARCTLDARPEIYEEVCDTLDALPNTASNGARCTLDARPEIVNTARGPSWADGDDSDAFEDQWGIDVPALAVPSAGKRMRTRRKGIGKRNCRRMDRWMLAQLIEMGCPSCGSVDIAHLRAVNAPPPTDAAS